MIGFRILWRDDVRRMRSIGCELQIKRLFCLAFAIDPRKSLLEENIGAVPLGRFEFAVVIDHGVEILIARSIATSAGIVLSDAAAPWMNISSNPRLLGQYSGSSPRCHLRTSRRVAGLLEDGCHRYGIEPQPLAFQNRMRDAVIKFMAACLEC